MRPGDTGRDCPWKDAGAHTDGGVHRSPRGELMSPGWHFISVGFCSSTRLLFPLARPGRQVQGGSRVPSELRSGSVAQSSPWDTDALNLSGKDRVWKNEELRQQAWRAWLLRGHALSIVGACQAQGQAAACCCAFEAKVASTRVPRTHHHSLQWCMSRVHQAEVPCSLPPSRPPCCLPLGAPVSAKHSAFQEISLGLLQTWQHLATVQVTSRPHGLKSDVPGLERVESEWCVWGGGGGCRPL